MEKLEVFIATGSILHVMDPNKPFVVETEASNFVVCVGLLQDGESVVFESTKLNYAQKKFLVYERKLFDIHSHFEDLEALFTWCQSYDCA